MIEQIAICMNNQLVGYRCRYNTFGILEFLELCIEPGQLSRPVSSLKIENN